MIITLSQYIDLLVPAVVLAILARLAVVLKLGLRNITKRIISLIFLNIYTPPHHALAHTILFFFSFFFLIDKANSKFHLKIKEALDVNWRKPNLNAQQNDLVLTFLQQHLQQSLLNRVLGVVACLACLRACVLTSLTCSRAWGAYVLACLACLRAWRPCMRVLCLHASYDACLACLPLTYSHFCLIIYFVCINQGYTIKRKLLIHVNLS